MRWVAAREASAACERRKVTARRGPEEEIMQSYRLRGVKELHVVLNRHPIHDVVDEGVHEDAVFVDARRRARLLGLRARAVEALSE